MIPECDFSRPPASGENITCRKTCRVKDATHRLWSNELDSSHKELGKKNKMDPNNVEKKMK